MSTTFFDLQQAVLRQLESYTSDDNVYGKLSGDITDSATTFTILGGVFGDGSGFNTGIMQINDELVYVREFDRSTGIATNVLRAWRGTTNVAHTAASSLVSSNPTYPNIDVQEAINDTIQGVYPDLFVVDTTEFLLTGSRVRYPMPDDARKVLSVRWQDLSATQTWNECTKWRFEPQPGGEVAGSRAIDIADGFPSRQHRVVYVAAPTTLSAAGDVFDTVTGLNDDWTKLIIYGAVSTLLAASEASRVVDTSANQKLLNQNQPIGSAQNLSQYFFGLYQQRLVAAKRQMLEMYPAPTHTSWW